VFDHEGEVLESYVIKAPGPQSRAEVPQDINEAPRTSSYTGDRQTSIRRRCDESRWQRQPAGNGPLGK
jgi:hypothetical protein